MLIGCNGCTKFVCLLNKGQLVIMNTVDGNLLSFPISRILCFGGTACLFEWYSNFGLYSKNVEPSNSQAASLSLAERHFSGSTSYKFEVTERVPFVHMSTH